MRTNRRPSQGATHSLLGEEKKGAGAIAVSNRDWGGHYLRNKTYRGRLPRYAQKNGKSSGIARGQLTEADWDVLP